MNNEERDAYCAINSLPYVLSNAASAARMATSVKVGWPTTYPKPPEEELAVLEVNPASLDDDDLDKAIRGIKRMKEHERSPFFSCSADARDSLEGTKAAVDAIEELWGMRDELKSVLTAKQEAATLQKQDGVSFLASVDAKLEALLAERESRRPMRMSELIDALKEQGIDIGGGKADAKGAKVANKQRGVKNKAMKVFNKSM